MKQFKLKKLIAALQAGTMTTLVCISLPVYASDIELYKAPRSSETTIMFMLDVSGSMNPDSNTYRENRIQSLKNGMTKLLQGDIESGVEPLPDKLVVGLSEFGGASGRVKLEARALGEKTDLPGSRPLFQTQQTFTQSVQRSVDQKRTWSATPQTRKQNGTRKYECFLFIICDWGSVSNWGPTNGGWLPTVINNSIGGSWVDQPKGNWTLIGSPQETSEVSNPQECITWNDSGSSCTKWETTLKTEDDFGEVIKQDESSQLNLSSNIIDSGYSLQKDSAPSYGEVQNGKETCNKENCERIQTRNAQITSTRTYTQTTTGSYTVTTTYYGTAKETHRKKMIRAVSALSATDSTPTGYAYAEVAAYLMGQTTKDQTGSGFSSSSSNTAIQDGSFYTAPNSINSTKQCNTQGIYFLTDGNPQYYYNKKQADLESFMKKSLGTAHGTNFSCSNDSTLGKLGSGYNNNNTMASPNGWNCIGAYTKALLDPTLNPAGVSIKTAVVGFGSDFSQKSSNDEKDADKWGVLGGGGSYVGGDDKAVVNSVMSFLKKLQKYIPPVTTGSATIPLDNLDPQNIQPWAYFPQFDPAPDAQVTTWVGNLKKYASRSNQLFDRDSKAIMNATTGISVDDPNDYWADTSVTKKIIKVVTENGKEVDKEIEVRVGGALSQLRLAKTTNERILYTDRKMAIAAGTSSTYVAHPLLDGELIKFGTNDLKTNNASNNLDKDPKRGYLAALLGYNVTNDMAGGLTQESNSTFNNYLVPANATLRQMGAVMHSKPIMLTQEGTTQFNKETGQLEYVNRDDLIVFGTTQGVLHVVKAGKSATDADAGKEVFAFVPSEMVDSQPQAFLDQQYQGRTLQYGIDGQWTTHTEYVSKYINKDDKTPTVTVKGGKQTLYGGLRMGGKSYYALDLSTVTSDPITSGKPKIKFKISPSGTCAANSPLGCMGQSWSKPSIGWVNWKGQRKLVMFVGGGYDERYESTSDYSSSGTDKGAGVYMFDAENGALLWWASSNVAADTNSNEETYVSNMTKSVVSQIKTIDRNSDGLIDHLYFGDLGGQLWRVDINSALKAGMSTTGTGDDQVIGQTFAKHVTRVLNMSGATAPRFYTTPTFTVHNGTGGLFGVVSIGSGNASFPMSSAANTNEGLYVIYDKDVAKRNLLVMASDALTTVDVSTSGEGSKKLVQNADGNTATEYANGGWYYPFTSKKKVLNDTAAVDSDLYVSVFDANVDIADVDCFGGVRGQSKVSQFCLPYGECRILSGTVYITQERPNDIFLGKGNIGISFGGQGKDRGLVLNLPSSGPFKTYNGRTQFISQRWYER